MNLTDHVEPIDAPGRRADDDDLDQAMQAGFAACRRVQSPEAAYRIGFADGLAWGIHQLIGSGDRGRAGVLIGSFDAFAADTCRSIHPKYGVLCDRDRHDDDAHFARVEDLFSHW